MPKKISRICFKVRVNYCCSGNLVSPNFFSRTPLIMILEISKIIFCLVVLMIAFCSKETYDSASGFSGFHSSILKSQCNLATPGLSQPFGEWPHTIHILLSLLQRSETSCLSFYWEISFSCFLRFHRSLRKYSSSLSWGLFLHCRHCFAYSFFSVVLLVFGYLLPQVHPIVYPDYFQVFRRHYLHRLSCLSIWRFHTSFILDPSFP